MNSFLWKSKLTLLTTITATHVAWTSPAKEIYIPFLDKNQTVAKANGKDIVLGEIEGIDAFNQQIEDSIVENYRRLIEIHVLTKLLHEESSKKKISSEALIHNQEKSVKLNKSDIENFKKQFPNLDPLKVTEAALTKKRKETIQKYYQEILHKNGYKFLINSKGLEIPVTTKTPSYGSDKATNVIHIFSDFQCRYCKDANVKINELKRDKASSVLIYFHHLPLSIHTQAYTASLAAQCAHDQNKFWQFHDRTFEKQDTLNKTTLVDIAKSLNLNMEMFSNCIESQQTKDLIDNSLKLASKFGISGTPTFIVNGKKKLGQLDPSELK